MRLEGGMLWAFRRIGLRVGWLCGFWLLVRGRDLDFGMSLVKLLWDFRFWGGFGAWLWLLRRSIEDASLGFLRRWAVVFSKSSF